MRPILTLLAPVAALFLSACASSVGGVSGESNGLDAGVLDQAVPAEQFNDSGERVLMQGVSPILDQSALNTGAAPEAQKFAISTEQGVFMMTQAQLNQYIAIQRSQSEANIYGGSPFGTVVSRTVVATKPISTSVVAKEPEAPLDPTSIASTRTVPGAFDRYVAPGITITQGPDGFKNADGTHDCVLTFDDGPHHERDALIYDILDQKGVKAVFFFLGEKVQANPNTTKTALARGHELGYHSWDHKNLRAESLATVKADFKKGMDVFASLGIAPKFYRPPFGNYNSGIIATAREYGMEVVNWTNDSLDWKIKTSDGIVQHVLKQSAPGDIVLLHSIHERSVQALPSVIDGLRAQGCRFTTLDAWFQRAGS